jgi:hypothetical protein
VTTHRRQVPLPYSSTAVEQPTLVQFLILSMLLHLLVIVLFGSTTGGEHRDEFGIWGPLDVILLRRLAPEPGPGVRLAPGAEQTSPGRALLRRSAGATDATPARPRIEKNVPAAKRPEPAPESTEAAQPTPAAPSPLRPAPDETLPRLNPEAPEEVDKPYTPSPISPPPIEHAPAPPVALPPRESPPAPEPPVESIAPPKVERQVAPPSELRPREAPIAPAPPAERIAPPKVEREVAPPVELAPREAPIAPAPAERAAPKVEREVAPPVELAPREAPIAPPAPVERIAPPKIEREIVPPVAVPAPRQTPAETVAPAAPEREAAPAPPAAPRAAPSEAAPRVEQAAPAAPAPDKLPADPPPSSGVAPAPPPARFHFGSPTPEDEVFRPRADVVPPMTEPEAQPYIDLEGARRAARKLATEGSGSRGLVPFPLPVPPPAEQQSKEARALEKAIKPDCRAAYAGLGLLAIPMLAASVIGDVGCRW